VNSLKANLISINQLCDRDLNVLFKHNKSVVSDYKGNISFEAARDGNVYTKNLGELTSQNVKCFATLEAKT